MDLLTAFFLTILFFYSMTQILKFYGVSQSSYGIFLLFYILMGMMILILPHKEKMWNAK
jgi:hypothetical protein